MLDDDNSNLTDPMLIDTVSQSGRIPLDVLVKLHESAPSMENCSGDCAHLVVKVRDMYKEAKTWQEEVSKGTFLSLKGVKRRTPLSPVKAGPEEVTDDDQAGAYTIDNERVIELSCHHILRKVSTKAVFVAIFVLCFALFL
jgi:hypothetical protein